MSVELAPWPEVGVAGGPVECGCGRFGYRECFRIRIQRTDLDTEKGYRTCIRIQKTDSDTENGIEHRTDFDSDRIRIHYKKIIRMQRINSDT